jgi:hypothetical protein
LFVLGRRLLRSWLLDSALVRQIFQQLTGVAAAEPHRKSKDQDAYATASYS